MESKKVGFSEQLLSPRRKVVSGFGLGVAATLIVFAVLLLSNSLKTPTGTRLFQGFNVVSVNSSRVGSWPFSFSTSVSNDSSDTSNKQVNSSVDLKSKSQKVNVSTDANERTDLGNLTGKVADAIFAVEEGSIQQITQQANGSAVAENGNILDSNVKKPVVENTRLANLSEIANNGNLLSEKGQICGDCSFVDKEDVNLKKPIENESVNNTSDANSQVLENSNVSNFLGDGGNAAEKNDTAISYDDSQQTKMHGKPYDKCDIFDGRWVRDNSKPYYPAGSCPYVDRDFDCHHNRRPDDGYVKWKWQPNGCDIPR